MSKNIIHRVQSQIFKRLNYFNFLDNIRVNNLMQSLAREVNDSGYNPEVIVGISSGGDYPTKKLSEQLNVEFTTIDVSHYSLSFLGLELDEIVGVYRITKTLGYKPKSLLIRDVTPDQIKNRKVLVVDDDSYSGITLQVARESILKKKPSDIKTAVLHTYLGNDEVDFAGTFYPKREYYDLKLRFPWSKISPYYEDHDSKKPLDEVVLSQAY